MLEQEKERKNEIEYNPFEKLSEKAKRKINLIKSYRINLSEEQDQVKQVEEIRKDIFDWVGEYLKKQPNIPKYYQKIRRKLNQIGNKVIPKEDLLNEMKQKIGYSKERIESGLKFLHNTGKVVYFDYSTYKNKELSEWIFFDVNFICNDVLGRLFCPNEVEQKRLTEGNTGIVKYSTLQFNFAQTLSIDILVELLLQMGICF